MMRDWEDRDPKTGSLGALDYVLIALLLLVLGSQGIFWLSKLFDQA